MSADLRRAEGTDWWTDDAGGWWHRPWWKVVINTVLRWLQPSARWKWVVYTESTEEGDPPTVLGYGFGPVEHRP